MFRLGHKEEKVIYPVVQNEWISNAWTFVSGVWNKSYRKDPFQNEYVTKKKWGEGEYTLNTVY